MSTEASTTPPVRRLALVVARHTARTGAPPGIDPTAFATACLADTYEVLADLVAVRSGIVGEGSVIEGLLWPGAWRLSGSSSTQALVDDLAAEFDEVVLVPGDVPDLPGLVLAKVFKGLQRADVCVAPERRGDGCVAIGLRLPLAAWVVPDLDLDHNPLEGLRALAPGPGRVTVGPDWHRMRTPASIQRLDPGLEGWEMTRSLLSGRELSLG